MHRSPGNYRGRRRLEGQSGRTVHRRLLTVAAAVGAVLIGTAALARTLPGEPAGVPTGASTSPDKESSTTTPSQLGTAPPVADPPDVPSATPSPEPPAPTPSPTEAPTPRPSPAEPVDLAFEAESADLSGFVRLFRVIDASGGEVVGMIGNNEGNHVRFTEVSVEEAGEYELTLYYLTVTDGEAAVTVNDGDPITVEFPGLDDLQTIDSVSVTVELAAGDNEIRFGRVTGLAPALDRITIAS